MARTRTTKAVAQRIDLNYFKRATPFKRAKLWLAIVAPVVALVWTGWHFFGHDSRVYSSGRLSAAHAVLEKQCAACHVQQVGGFSATAADSGCLACHDGPVHHDSAKNIKLACAECHVEHRGRMNLSAATNQSCAQCHGDLSASNIKTEFAKHIQSFGDRHPEFAALRTAADGAATRDPGTIKLNHGLHMKPIRRGPTGPMLQLECNDCHRPSASRQTRWEYGDAKYVAATAYKTSDEFVEITSRGLAARRPASGRELMAPPTFANACAGCHLLTFDARFDEGVPHDKPEVIHAFLVQKFSEYIAAHPAELQVTRDAQRLAGRPIPPEVRSFTASKWVSEKTADAEMLLWRKTCSQCHALTGFVMMPDAIAAQWAGPLPRISIFTATLTSLASHGAVPKSVLPDVAPANIKLQWMPHARFDHDAHRGFSCVGCHQKALKSTEASDILIPGIAVCQTCHAPGAGYAESRCFECHTYHDWAKRKEVKPMFTMPGLVSRGN
jgi:hypothetical protein